MLTYRYKYTLTESLKYPEGLPKVSRIRIFEVKDYKEARRKVKEIKAMCLGRSRLFVIDEKLEKGSFIKKKNKFKKG